MNEKKGNELLYLAALGAGVAIPAAPAIALPVVAGAAGLYGAAKLAQLGWRCLTWWAKARASRPVVKNVVVQRVVAPLIKITTPDQDYAEAIRRYQVNCRRIERSPLDPNAKSDALQAEMDILRQRLGQVME